MIFQELSRDYLRTWGERIQTKDLDDLRDELLVKNRGDNRVGIALKWLEVLGITSGSFETHDLSVVRDLEPGELPDFVGGEEKHQGDLQALLGMVEFARDAATCRRVLLARHFGLDEPEPPCGACDACTAADEWLEGRASQRPALEAGPAAAPEVDDAPFKRGDWVKIDGRHLGCVVRVEGSGRDLKLVVESASDLRRRTVNPRRKRVELVPEN